MGIESIVALVLVGGFVLFIAKKIKDSKNKPKSSGGTGGGGGKPGNDYPKHQK